MDVLNLNLKSEGWQNRLILDGKVYGLHLNGLGMRPEAAIQSYPDNIIYEAGLNNRGTERA